MLVGHEVGHALFTPNVDFREQVDCPKDFVNVIEDARIEKLMKRKYAGLRKSFAQGYTELNNKDFFEVADKDLSEFSLIDRINLHFKLGATALVPFNGSEMVFVARTDQAETFEEVLEIAQDVYNWEQTQKTEEKEVEVELDSSSRDGIGDMEGEAHSEAQTILAEAKSIKEKMITDAVDEAKKKAEIETQNALQSINAEKEKAVNEIKSAAVELSIQAASKLIEKNLDDNDNRKLVNEAIDKIGQA